MIFEAALDLEWWFSFVASVAQPLLIAMIWGLIRTWKNTSKQSTEAFVKAQEALEEIVQMKEVLVNLRTSLEELSHTLNYVSKQIDRQEYRLSSLEEAKEKQNKQQREQSDFMHSLDIRLSVLEQQ